MSTMQPPATVEELGLTNITKAFDAKIVADQRDADNREFTAIVAAFDVVDSEDDVFVAGAFAGEIDRLATTGKSLPVVWDHQHKDPHAYIGSVLAMEELAPGDPRLTPELLEKGGLWVRGELDDDPAAEKVRKLMKGGRITQFSFVSLGGRYRPAQRKGRTVREIHQVQDMIEVGPTLRGMNTSTALLTIKSNQQPTELPSPQPNTAQTVVPGEDVARFISMLSLY